MDVSFKDFRRKNTITIRDLPDREGNIDPELLWSVPPFDAETELTLRDIEAQYLEDLKANEGTPALPGDVQLRSALYWAEQVACMVREPDTLEARQLADTFDTFTLRTIAEGAKGLFRFGYRADWMQTA